MAAGSSVLGRLSLVDERRPALATARRLALVLSLVRALGPCPAGGEGGPRRVVASPWAGGYAGWPAVASKVVCSGSVSPPSVVAAAGWLACLVAAPSAPGLDSRGAPSLRLRHRPLR